ncbi:hypothetical protein MJO28_000642 [Puccinia striiformis f. sp. tritici]|uniref:Uncharacterized protein n=1 Tax=Puccinia striiformis f. sp. tritici TaxID=168172 RepID=A0ACC0EY00_9BASI|nr:hypothetical protein MJO28_000642 [Puccinia striiformis f. sp. tritici]
MESVVRVGGGTEPDQRLIEKTTLNRTPFGDLQSSFLPLFRRAVTTYALSLYPSYLNETAEERVKHISMARSTIKATIDSFNNFWFYRLHQHGIGPEDKRHLELVQWERGNQTNYFSLTSLPLSLIYRAADVLVEPIEDKVSRGEAELLTETYFRVIWFSKETVRIIDTAIASINKYGIVDSQAAWPWQLEKIDVVLWRLAFSVQPESYLFFFPEQPPTLVKLIRELVIQLAKLAIPLIRLSKLFFSKLTTPGINIRGLPCFEKMCPNKIISLEKSLEQVTTTARKLRSLVQRADEDPPGVVIGDDFIELAIEIETLFDFPLMVVLLHIVPSIPDTDGFPTHKYYKRWFTTWNTKLISASENFINLAESFDHDMLCFNRRFAGLVVR